MPGFDLVDSRPDKAVYRAVETAGSKAQKSGFFGSSTIFCSILSNCVNHLVSIEKADLDHLRQ